MTVAQVLGYNHPDPREVDPMKLLFRILLTAPLLLAPRPLPAQRVAPVPAYAVATLPPLASAPHFAADSLVQKLPRTYWLEGGLIGGVSLGLMTLMWARGMRESNRENIVGDVAGFALGFGTGFAAGSLVGGQFHKAGSEGP